MSVKEKIRRLGEMSGAEIRFRAAQQWRLARERWAGNGANGAHAQWWRAWDVSRPGDPDLRALLESGHGNQAQRRLPEYFRARATPRFYFDARERAAIVAAHRDRFPARAAEIRAEADAICEHRFRIFGYGEVNAGAEIPWRRDLVHGKETGLRHWTAIPSLDLKAAGDSKIVWEPNRHQHFFTLGQAWLLTGEERYAEECLAQFEHWQRENPYARGINWASSLEVAFRAWSWLWTLNLLAGSAALNGQRIAQLTLAMSQAARFIAENLSTYFSPNTHLLGEGFALYAIGGLLPELRGAAEWRASGRRILEAEMTNQVRPDGTHMEQSTYYHRYATDFFLCAAILAERNGEAFPVAWRARLEKMCEVIQHCMLPSGLQPMMGDADGGRLLAFDTADVNDARGVLSTAAMYFHRPDFQRAAGELREETLWLLGADAAREFDSPQSVAPHETSRAFADGGLCVTRSGWDARAHVLLFDAGPQGMPGCAHGHADALSVVCSADGIDWLVDPGTHVYTASAASRDFFRSTRAHNTVVVDGQDQADRVDTFKWRNIPQPELRNWSSLPSLDFACGSHNGYARLSGQVTHRRTVIFVKPDYWLVSDEMLGAGTHLLESFFHYAPGARVAPEHGGWLASCGGSRLFIAQTPTMDAKVIEGQASPLQGWYSADYGHREPAPVLMATMRAALPQQMHWILWPVPAAWARLRSLPGAGARVAVETEAWTDFFVVRGGETPADAAAELTTDAELAYTRRERSGSFGKLAVINGCCVDFGSQPLLRAESMLDELEVTRENGALEIHMRPLRRATLYAPGVTNVRVNGAEVNAIHRGDFVEVGK